MVGCHHVLKKIHLGREVRIHKAGCMLGGIPGRIKWLLGWKGSVCHSLMPVVHSWETNGMLSATHTEVV